MPCSHKFFGHRHHLANENGLLPNWDVDTLIIGTFNPSNEWVANNPANYFYGRSRYFWKVLPRFACGDAINNNDVTNQLDFLQTNRIGLTDLLISINDANIDNVEHLNWVRTYLDNDLFNFEEFTWNTVNIIRFIQQKKVKAVYFTKMGNGAPFGSQMEIIEAFCNMHNIPILQNFRIHTPTGQGLGAGTPRVNRLTHRWFEQGGNQFPFLCPDFNINNPDFAWHI